MSKHYGLIGAHRTGKTTSAKKFAIPPHVQYLEIATSPMLVEMGYNARDQYDIGTRLLIQEQLLDRVEPLYANAPCSITDRTPLDFLIYMQADIVRDFPQELEERFEKYYLRCVQMYFDYFLCGCVIQPGIPIVDDLKSAPPSKAYIYHLNTLAVGIAEKLNICVMPDTILGLGERDEYLSDLFFSYHDC